MAKSKRKKKTPAKAQAHRRARGYYETQRFDPQRKIAREYGGPNAAISGSPREQRAICRQIEQNYDLFSGLLDILCRNVVGPHGITAEFMPRRPDGKIHREFARELRRAHKAWAISPDVTGELSWSEAQRQAYRTYVRDGEIFTQLVLGDVPGLTHGSAVPCSIELLEPDFVPEDYNDPGRRISHGIRTNAWGRPVSYIVYRSHPADSLGLGVDAMSTKEIPADRMLHFAAKKRLHQRRGVSPLAVIVPRMSEIKDYEYYERSAAKVAAALTVAIIRSGTSPIHPAEYQQGRGDEADDEERQARRKMIMSPAMIFDDLDPGDDVKSIKAERPNPELSNFLAHQTRMAATGSGVGYSELSNAWEGTYIAKRMERLVQEATAQVSRDKFIGAFVRPIVTAFLRMGVVSGAIRVPPDVVPESVYSVNFSGTPMPWLDMEKEAKAFETLERNNHASGPEVLRRRGIIPDDYIEEEQAWQESLREAGLALGGQAESQSDDDRETDNNGNMPAGLRLA